MTVSTRRIGLSLGADICWPRCFEDILADLDLSIDVDGETVKFEVERVTIEPFDLRQPTRYDVVIDRLTHWYHVSREWIKKSILMDGVYVFNNPWSVQSMEKQTTYCALMHLGFPVPDTLLIPPKSYDDLPDLQPTLERYARLFDLDELGDKLGYPVFMKPYDGGGWVGVTKIDDTEELRDAYDKSGKFVMHLQKGLVPHEGFVRCVGLGPQTRIVRYDADAPLHDRYCKEANETAVTAADAEHIRKVTLTINAFFGWDFNSCELIAKDGVWHPFDYANPCPDSQVTSLHWHWPWLLLAKLKWSVFCAATRRPMRLNLDWSPFYAIAAEDGMTFEERLDAYAKVAEERLGVAEFEEFCAEKLGGLEQVALEYMGTDRCRDAVREKVAALFPEDEVEEFTELFWERIQVGRGLV